MPEASLHMREDRYTGLSRPSYLPRSYLPCCELGRICNVLLYSEWRHCRRTQPSLWNGQSVFFWQRPMVVWTHWCACSLPSFDRSVNGTTAGLHQTLQLLTQRRWHVRTYINDIVLGILLRTYPRVLYLDIQC